MKANTVAIDIHNIVNAVELKEIIEMQLDAIFNDPSVVNTLRPIIVRGSPGVGKSTIVRSICEQRGIDFIDFRAAQCEPCDIRGLPVPNREKNQMDWFVNGVWPRDPNGKGIIFLDELTSCDKSVQTALYELILDRRLGKLYTVPNGYLIVAAGNNTTDKAVATTMSSALANRFMHLELKDDAEAWLSWARHNNVHPAVIGFITYKPNMLFKMDDENLERGWPSPRSWEGVSQICHLYKSVKDNVLRKMIYGLVGNGAGIEFMAFYKLNAEFDDILEIMTNPTSKINIPDAADRKFAMVSAMNYLLWRGKDKTDQEARLTGFLRICIELPSDFASMALLAAMEGNDKKMLGQYSNMIVNHKLFEKWRQKHQDALLKHMKKFKAYGI